MEIGNLVMARGAIWNEVGIIITLSKPNRIIIRNVGNQSCNHFKHDWSLTYVVKI